MAEKMTDKEIEQSMRDVTAWNKRGQSLLMRSIYSALLEILDSLKIVIKELEIIKELREKTSNKAAVGRRGDRRRRGA